jgi:hypothetical protein
LSERLSGKARCYAFKDLMLTKTKIHMIGEDHDMDSEKGKKLTIADGMN